MVGTFTSRCYWIESRGDLCGFVLDRNKFCYPKQGLDELWSSPNFLVASIRHLYKSYIDPTSEHRCTYIIYHYNVCLTGLASKYFFSPTGYVANQTFIPFCQYVKKNFVWHLSFVSIWREFLKSNKPLKIS